MEGELKDTAGKKISQRLYKCQVGDKRQKGNLDLVEYNLEVKTGGMNSL